MLCPFYTPYVINILCVQELIGSAGGKLHTGRSRNDQVATDLRLWLRQEIDQSLDGFLVQIIQVCIIQLKTYLPEQLNLCFSVWKGIDWTSSRWNGYSSTWLHTFAAGTTHPLESLFMQVLWSCILQSQLNTSFTIAIIASSYAWSLWSDWQRLMQLRDRVNVMPLGSGALAGNPFPIDRHYLSDLMGFDSITPNSLLGVSDRDFVGKFDPSWWSRGV